MFSLKEPYVMFNLKEPYATFSLKELSVMVSLQEPCVIFSLKELPSEVNCIYNNNICNLFSFLLTKPHLHWNY